MPQSPPPAEIDRRFSDPEAEPTPWGEAERALEQAELYWLTTLRANGRPHVTPLIGLWDERGFVFCTGIGEQKERNLTRDGRVAVTTGTNRWAEGLDVVVEGEAARLTGAETLRRIAEAYVAKYGERWRFDLADEALTQGPDHRAPVYRVEPAKVLAFAKSPHAQTRFRLGGS